MGFIKGKVAEEFGFYSLDVIEMKRLDFISSEEVLQVDYVCNDNFNMINKWIFF